jgi:penicillin G amidase
MRIVKRVLWILSIIAVVIFVSGLIFLNRLRVSALPEYNRNVHMKGLTNEVIILRDSFAIPHIYAENELDLYRAVGFAMAQDRLWQMDLLRRVTQGRLSEIMGKEQIETDLLMWALRIQEKSERVLAQSSPQILSALEAFADGVNYYIENYKLPPEFRILRYKPEAWQPVHSVNLVGYMSWDLTSGWRTEMVLYQLSREITSRQLQSFLPQVGVHRSFVYPDFSLYNIPSVTVLSAGENLQQLGIQVFEGSNNWAVSGNRSKTGIPLLANDMHLGLFAPGIWYQMHHVVNGSLNVTGLVLPGQPFVIAGHNDSIAWGMTNVTVDDLDFYAETLSNDSTQYLLDGQWRDLLVKEELIHTGKGDTVREKLKFTHRGPLVNRFRNETETALSIRWMGNETSNELRAVYLLNRASNWENFRDAVSSFRSVSQNIVYADVAGNIGLQTSAGVPLRRGSGIEIYPGDTSLYDWTGFVPFEELPYEFNPERGYVSSANNRTAPEAYPYLIGTWYALPDRIDCIREMLEEKELYGRDDFMQMHNDYKSKKAELFTPSFINALNSHAGWNDQQINALNLLEVWDYILHRESSAASVFEILYRRVAENLVKDDLSPEMFQLLMGERILVENLMINILNANDKEWADDRSTPENESWIDIVVRAFVETVTELTEKLGIEPEDWHWGKIHTFTISHPLGVVNILDKAFHLNRGPFGVPGSYHTVTPYSYSYNNLYKVNHGASHRHVFDLSDWNASKTVIPTGTSGIPASEHYLDQTGMYLDNHYHTDPFSREEVHKKARYTMKLLPE